MDLETALVISLHYAISFLLQLYINRYKVASAGAQIAMMVKPEDVMKAISGTWLYLNVTTYVPGNSSSQ